MKVVLRPAVPSDRADIYRWLAHSDATPEMMGPPRFTDSPVPTYEEFCADYHDAAYTGAGDLRLYVIEIDRGGIGAISSWLRDRIAEIDLWIGDRTHWGHGFGASAIRQLAARLFTGGETDMLIIRPSARNRRAIAAYRSAGFTPLEDADIDVPDWVTTEGLDYHDTVVLVWPYKL